MLIYVNDRYALKTIDEAKWVRGGELGYPHVLCRKNISRIFLASEFFLVIGDMLPILKIPKKLLLQFSLREIINGLDYIASPGGRRSPVVACWASDHWVASSNPLRGKFRH